MPKAPRPAKLTDSALELIAARFRILGEPSRLKLLMTLQDGEKTVSELIETTGATQTNVSRQLGILTTAGLLARRKNGLNVLYRIIDPGLFDLCGHVCKSLQARAEAQSQVFVGSPSLTGTHA